MSEVTTRLKNLFKIHRFHYTIIFSDGSPTHTGSGHSGKMRTEFDMALSDLALSGKSTDGMTFQVVKS